MNGVRILLQPCPERNGVAGSTCTTRNRTTGLTMPSETKQAHRTTSRFAAALRALLDETGIFTREEWSDVLGVSTAALSQWVNDSTIPRATSLRSLLDAVRRHK